LWDALTDLNAALGGKFVEATNYPPAEHVWGVSNAGAFGSDGRHRHAKFVRPTQTSHPRLISTDAAIMMNSSASASFGREIRRINCGIRTANDDATVRFRRKLYHAIDYHGRNVF